eukprot:2610999-Amphidinium_carterae.1
MGYLLQVCLQLFCSCASDESVFHALAASNVGARPADGSVRSGFYAPKLDLAMRTWDHQVFMNVSSGTSASPSAWLQPCHT